MNLDVENIVSYTWIRNWKKCYLDEYRILLFSNNDYEYIDIQNSLKGIIIPKNRIIGFSLDTLKQYAKNNIELLYIDWTDKGIEISSCKVEEDDNECY